MESGRKSSAAGRTDEILSEVTSVDDPHLTRDQSDTNKIIDGSSEHQEVEEKPFRKKTLGEVLRSKFFIGVVIVCVLIVTLLCIGLVATYEKDNDGIIGTIDAWNDKISAEQLVWFEAGLNDLRHALNVGHNTKRAKNVILFVADGMGPATVTAARIYKEREEGYLNWERFPHMGLLKVSKVMIILANKLALNHLQSSLPLLVDLLHGQTSPGLFMHRHCALWRRQEQLRDRWCGCQC